MRCRAACSSFRALQVTISLLQRAMDESGKHKFLIDGFPRNEENRASFEKQVWGCRWGSAGVPRVRCMTGKCCCGAADPTRGACGSASCVQRRTERVLPAPAADGHRARVCALLRLPRGGATVGSYGCASCSQGKGLCWRLQMVLTAQAAAQQASRCGHLTSIGRPSCH